MLKTKRMTGYLLATATVLFLGGTQISAHADTADELTASVASLPSAPGGLYEVPGNGQVTIHWSAVSGASSYNIYHNGIKVNAVPITATTYLVQGLTNGTVYHFIVTAANIAGESTPSSDLLAMPYANQLIPHMTGYNSPSGQVTYSSENPAIWDYAWQVFDGTDYTGWQTDPAGVTSGWVAYDFQKPVVVREYSLWEQKANEGRNPKAWNFEAWDGQNWIVLDSQSGVTDWSSGVLHKYFTINNNQAYSKYRINLLANNGANTVVLYDLQLAGDSQIADLTPPVTTATRSGTESETTADVYSSAVNVTLAATDNLSGVATTQYRINGGDWQTYTGPINLTSDGSYTIDYRSTDKAGNVESTQSTSFLIDQTAPVTTVDLPQPTGTGGWYTSAVTIPMTCNEDLSGIARTEYSINGGEWVTYTGPVTLTQDGTYTIAYRSIDKAGNVEQTKTVEVNIDQTAPVVSMQLPPTGSNGWYTTSVPITITGTDNLSGVQTIQYRINGGAWMTYTGSFTAVHDGICTIEIRGTDGAGNTGNPIPIVLKIDKTPPTLSVQVDKSTLWPPNHKLIPIHVNVLGSDAGSGIASIVLTSITSNEPDDGLGDGDTAQDIQGADFGTFDTDFLLRAERSGSGTGRVYTITYTATDYAGNVTHVSVTVTVPHDQK